MQPLAFAGFAKEIQQLQAGIASTSIALVYLWAEKSTPCRSSGTVPSAAAAGEQQPQGSSALPQLRQQTGDADVARGRVVLSVRPRVRQRMW